MIACGLAAVALACALAPRVDEYAAAMDALGAGRFVDAWTRLEGCDELDRWRGRAAVLSAAGDLSGALAMAEEGLRAAPTNLDLLYHATQNAVALRDDRAVEWFARLAAAVESAGLSEDHRAGWDRALTRFEPAVGEIERATRERARVLGRARGFSLAALGVAFLALAALARPGRGAASAGPR